MLLVLTFPSVFDPRPVLNSLEFRNWDASNVARCIWKSRASSVSALKYAAAAADSSLMIPDESPSRASDRPQEGRKPVESPARYGMEPCERRPLGGPPSLDAGDANGELEMQPEPMSVMDEELEWWPPALVAPPMEWWRGDAVVEQLPSRRSPVSAMRFASVQLKPVLSVDGGGMSCIRLWCTGFTLWCRSECCRLLDGCENPCTND